MSLAAHEIAALVAELQPLRGSRLDAVRGLRERALALSLRGPAGPAWLLVSAEADLTRLHALSARPPAPRQPPPFQAAVRRELEGARLAGLSARPGDRVATLEFERGGRRASLVAELTGRHGNLFLVDESGVIRASAGRNLSERRALVPGRPYVPPAPRPPEGPRAPRFAPVAGAPFPLSAAVEACYRELEAERALREGRRRLREPLRAAADRSRRALAKLAEEAARVPAAEADRRLADLLKANLQALPRGRREAVLTEWTAEGPREVRVTLDPALTPRQNMERYYRRFRRIADSAARVEGRAAEVRGRLEALQGLLLALERAGPEALPRLEREARRAGAAPRREEAPRRRREQPPPPWRVFRTLGGAAVLVGKSAHGNDALLRQAGGNDGWLHARGRGGAHVVLRLGKGKAPGQEDLLDAAHLAAHFSEARGEPTVEVAWTRARHVRKPRGAAPGAVTYSQERTLPLRLEPARLSRLLAAEEGNEDEP
ncbi:MAG TPA: NFACT RNA binding domain-containing protein [Anaeromyxobacteraceae bacterium]|nr:NFACT RNA binding domain-containing protein [Anaeromyxobacteraceae bacterium]